MRDGGRRIDNLNELEYINGEIYANLWMQDRIARISPETGKVLSWIDLTGILPLADRRANVDVLNGIAYDEEKERLFVTGKLGRSSSRSSSFRSRIGSDLPGGRAMLVVPTRFHLVLAFAGSPLSPTLRRSSSRKLRSPTSTLQSMPEH